MEMQKVLYVLFGTFAIIFVIYIAMVVSVFVKSDDNVDKGNTRMMANEVLKEVE